MESLSAKGYHGVTLGQVWDAWHHDGYLPAKPVVVSFDDGYHGIFTRALPVRRQAGGPGRSTSRSVCSTSRAGGLSRVEVRGLIRAGWEVDSHTINHPDLTTIGPDELRSELVDSRDRIKSEFGVTARFFCYPAGRYNAAVIAAVKDVGLPGGHDDPQPGVARRPKPSELPRVRINGSDGVDGLRREDRRGRVSTAADQGNFSPSRGAGDTDQTGLAGGVTASEPRRRALESDQRRVDADGRRRSRA